MKQTKEQLLVEVIKLRDSHANWVSKDESRRKEFAKAFNWYESKGMYDYGDRKSLLPSWEQIFVEVGKLLAAKTFYDLEGNVSELEYSVKDIQEKLKNNNL